MPTPGLGAPTLLPRLGLLLLLLGMVAHALPPVVLFNGLSGAVIKARLNRTTVPHYFCAKQTPNYTTIWLNPVELLPGQIDCFFDNAKIHFDPKTRRYFDTEGVLLNTSYDFGGVGGLEYLDPDLCVGEYYHPLIAALQAQGYVVGQNLHGAPYDWRLAPDGLATKPALADGTPYFHALRDLVEATVRRNGAPAVLVTHSMGALVALSFLTQQKDLWKYKHIQTLVTVSAPFGGSLAALKAVVSGDTLGYPLEHHFFHPIQSTSASGPWLFPRASLWPRSETLIRTPTRNYTSADYLRIMRELGLQQAEDMLAAGVHNLTLETFPAPQVPVEVVYGTGLKTESGYTYHEDFVPGRIPGPPVYHYEADGDGTVPVRSLARATAWVQRWRVRVTTFPGQQHFDILASKPLIDFVVKLLHGLAGDQR